MIPDVELKDLENKQLEFSKNIIIEKLNSKTRHICGVDIAYWEHEGQEFGVCSAIVYDVVDRKIVEKVSRLSTISFPYISGFLGFRECELELNTINCLKSKVDLLMVDGNGMLHPRKAGEAVQLGVELEIPTIGVAKSYLKIDGMEYTGLDTNRGSYVDLKIKDETVGRALRTMDNTKPVFVSIGNKVTLDEAAELVLELCDGKSHVPIPTRIADIETHLLRKRYKETLEFKGEF